VDVDGLNDLMKDPATTNNKLSPCWICGNPSNSREHSIKASDMRQEFPKISQSAPIFRHEDGKRSRRIGSAKSDRLKSTAPICRKCNTVRTQPFDLAWELFSAYIKVHRSEIMRSRSIPAKNIFKGNRRQSLLNVHLFFLKHLGCRIIEEQVPIEIDELANCIREVIAHPEFFIEFVVIPHRKRFAQLSHIELQQQESTKKVKSVICTYEVGKWAMGLTYKPSTNVGLPKTWWHPNNKGNRIPIAIENH